MTDVPTAPTFLFLWWRQMWWRQMHLHQVGNLTRIHDADIVCDEGGAHVRSRTRRGAALCSWARASFIATASRPIDVADLATAACQVHRDSWTRQRRRFRHAPPRRSLE